MKLLSTLLLFSAAVWVTAMAWPKDIRDKFLEYLENQGELVTRSRSVEYNICVGKLWCFRNNFIFFFCLAVSVSVA